MKNIRLAKMEKMIIEKKIVTLKELQSEFNISMNTVRRDINELIENENIKKINGGVQYDAKSLEFKNFDERKSKEKDAKELIGRKASRFVEDGDIIYIDSGTTTVNLSYYLCTKKNLTLITNNLQVIFETSHKDNINLISLGGELNKKSFSFADKKTTMFLKDLNIDKAFMSSTGLSVKNGATNSIFEEKEIKSEVISRAKKVFLLIDHSKFEKNTLFTFCKIDNIDCIITDKAPENYRKIATDHNIELIECL